MSYPVSEKARTLIGSEIIRLAAEINQKIAAGSRIFNLTIGDFNPEFYPIPEMLQMEVARALAEGQTNYPPADGVAATRAAVLAFLKRRQGLDYGPDEILITSGARPAIYSMYQTVLDPGDKVIYPIPSWNNNHYCHLSSAQRVEVPTTQQNAFMPVRQDIQPHVHDATLLALCSPLNPTGTAFTRHQLESICDMVLEENLRRGPDRKPLYILYDQIYWLLAMDGVEHYDPVGLRPELRPYTVFVDGISKCFAATGLRVGWTLGPAYIISRMKSVNSHMGAWAPKAEQIATARFMADDAAVDAFLTEMKARVNRRLEKLYQGLDALRREGLPVDVITPQGAIYLTVRFALKGCVTDSGQTLSTAQDIGAYLLQAAQLAVVPFTAFGAADDTDWFRASVGTCREAEIPELLSCLRQALTALTPATVGS